MSNASSMSHGSKGGSAISSGFPILNHLVEFGRNFLEPVDAKRPEIDNYCCDSGAASFDLRGAEVLGNTHNHNGNENPADQATDAFQCTPEIPSHSVSLTSKSLNLEDSKNALHAELWISWASLLRSYGAAHGMSSTQQAVVEVGVDEIVVRAGGKWVRITQDELESSDGSRAVFALNKDGTVTLDGKIDEMDLAAERITRELMQ